MFAAACKRVYAEPHLLYRGRRFVIFLFYFIIIIVSFFLSKCLQTPTLLSHGYYIVVVIIIIAWHGTLIVYSYVSATHASSVAWVYGQPPGCVQIISSSGEFSVPRKLTSRLRVRRYAWVYVRVSTCRVSHDDFKIAIRPVRKSEFILVYSLKHFTLYF